MIKPKALKPGDTIATVSLSWGGAGLFPHRYEAGKRQLMDAFGLRVVEMPHALRPPEWVAQNPRARARDLMQALSDPAIHGIISCIGGDDSIRTLPYTDLEVIRNHPKVFMGFSDTTVTHFAFLKAGVVSFYGPSILAGFGENGGLHGYLANSVRQILFGTQIPGAITPNTTGWTVERLEWARPELQGRVRTLQPSDGWHWLQGSGVAHGRLIGGCLEVLDWLRGSDYWPSREEWRGALLFIETSEEAPPPETVVRMLRPLMLMGILPNLSGVLMGRPGGATLTVADHARHEHAVHTFLRDECGLPDLPLVTNMDFGHTDPIMTLPLGVMAELDCDRRVFSITEAATLKLS